MSISPTTDAVTAAHRYSLDTLAVNSYYELDVRALNDLDHSPPLRPPFIFFTHPGTASDAVYLLVYYGTTTI